MIPDNFISRKEVADWLDGYFEEAKKQLIKVILGEQNDQKPQETKIQPLLTLKEKRKINPKAKWTHAETNELIELYNAGFTYTEIAKELNRTPNAINIRIGRIRDGQA